MSPYADPVAVMQVIGSVFNNVNLLDMTDKYVITDDDFDNEFHKIVFGAIYKIHELGAKEITLETISDFLSTRPKAEAIYKKNKGEEWILEVAENSIPTAFDYYYNRMRKMTLLREFDKHGIDVKFIYDPDILLDTQKKQIQEDNLDNISLAQIANKVADRIEEIKYKYVNNEFEDISKASDGLRTLLDNFKKHPEAGTPMYGPLINTVTRGARLGKFYLRSAPTGVGKAIPNNTLIPTPLGWRKVGDIKVGDYLFGRDGKPTKVLNVFPQGEKEIWNVTFSDGRTANCCKDHLWTYGYESNGEIYYQTESTEQIYKKALKLKNSFKDCNFRIPLNQAVEYDEKKYSIYPYDMGVVLGDHHYPTNPELKFIPREYLEGNIEQRLLLLDGLLQANGSTDTFTTISKKLRDNVIELCYSLGMIVNCSTVENHYDIHIQKGEYLTIASIEPNEQKTEMTCFTVDNEEHLFLINDFIVTHNTRSMIADACFIGCDMYYNENFGWLKNGICEPVLYITTEQKLDEIQTLMLAFLSGVNESHIIYNDYEEGEEERVLKAVDILENSPIYIDELPDFSLQDIENHIKKGIRDYGVSYVFLDYIHSSIKILEEITQRSGGVKLREDNILFMMSIKIKDICNQYDVFILSATQLNGTYKESESPDQNLLRGAKSIADWTKFYNKLWKQSSLVEILSDYESVNCWKTLRAY